MKSWLSDFGLTHKSNIKAKKREKYKKKHELIKSGNGHKIRDVSPKWWGKGITLTSLVDRVRVNNLPRIHTW